MSDPFDPDFNGVPPDIVARWKTEREKGIAADRARIAAGQYGDVPDPLTEEDEAILDRAWAALRAKPAAEQAAEAAPEPARLPLARGA